MVGPGGPVDEGGLLNLMKNLWPITDQQGMLSGEEKVRELVVLENTIRVVWPDGPGAVGACLTW